MEFFSNFTWAVPYAFSDAVGLCRFEKGDKLYDTTKAYNGEWSNAFKYINYSLYVQYPIRTTFEKKEGTGSVFEKNWNLEVQIDLYKKQKKIGIGIKTTQGRLYTALWKGDLTILEKNNSAEPLIPINARQVTKQLKEVESKALKFSDGLPVFTMVYDHSNQVSKEKYLKIYTKLSKYVSKKLLLLEPKEAGLNDWENIAPTIKIAFFPVKDINCEQLESIIKKAVYIPLENTKVDMFKITSHGEIFI